MLSATISTLMTSVADTSMWMRSLRLALLASLFFVVLSGCSREETSWRFEGKTMGSSYQITVVAPPDGVARDSLEREIASLLAQLHNTMSTYDSASELSRLSRAPAGEWLAVSATLFDVLATATEVSALSNGAFDVTVAPLVNLWGFGPADTQDKVPGDAEITAALAQVGFRHLELRMEPLAVRKRKPVSLDLSAIGHGYGADRVAALLDARGVTRYLADVAGEMRFAGLNARGMPWRIGIETPDQMPGTVYKAVKLTSGGMATSGDYRNYFEKDGKRYSHTIDPATGRPVQHTLASVTVIAETAAEADAWATALDVLGPEKGRSLAESMDLAAFFIVREGEGFRAYHTPSFESFLDQSLPE